MTVSTPTAEDIDRMVDDGEDVTACIRMDTVAQPRLHEAEGAGRLRQVNATRPVPPSAATPFSV